MNFPKITINNANNKNENNISNVKKKSIIQKIKTRKKMIDSSTSTIKNLDYNYNIPQILPTEFNEFNNYNKVLPKLVIKPYNINTNNNYHFNIKNNNKKNISREIKDLYNYYHSLLSNSYNNNELNKFMSHCYDIIKIDTPINDNYRINKTKLKNKYLRDVEIHHKISNLFLKKKLNYKYNNIKTKKYYSLLKTKNIITKNKTNLNNKFEGNINLTYLKPTYNQNKSHSLEKTYSPLRKKNLLKRETHSINDYYLNDFISIKNYKKPSSSFNTIYSRKKMINGDFEENITTNKNIDINNNNLGRNNYKTIKIKKIISSRK